MSNWHNEIHTEEWQRENTMADADANEELDEVLEEHNHTSWEEVVERIRRAKQKPVEGGFRSGCVGDCNCQCRKG